MVNEVVPFLVTSNALLSPEHPFLTSPSSSPSDTLTLLLLPEHSTGASSEADVLALPDHLASRPVHQGLYCPSSEKLPPIESG